MKETLYTLHYKETLPGETTETIQHSKPNLTKKELEALQEELSSWLYSLEHGDLDPYFWDLETEEH